MKRLKHTILAQDHTIRSDNDALVDIGRMTCFVQNCDAGGPSIKLTGCNTPLKIGFRASAIATALRSWTPRAANRKPNQNRCHYKGPPSLFGTLFAGAAPSLIATFVVHVQRVVLPRGANACTSKAYRVYLLQTFVGTWHYQMSLSSIRDFEYISSMQPGFYYRLFGRVGFMGLRRKECEQQLGDLEQDMHSHESMPPLVIAFRTSSKPPIAPLLCDSG